MTYFKAKALFRLFIKPYLVELKKLISESIKTENEGEYVGYADKYNELSDIRYNGEVAIEGDISVLTQVDGINLAGVYELSAAGWILVSESIKLKYIQENFHKLEGDPDIKILGKAAVRGTAQLVRADQFEGVHSLSEATIIWEGL